MRIIAGNNRGTLISAPRGTRTRPTADKVRGAIFNMLGDVTGLTVLDLFAGSGALGLEAVSRGAAEATLIDNRQAALDAIHKNTAKLRLENASALRRDYLSFLKSAARKEQRFDLIFIDPPYRMHRVIGPELARWLPHVVATGGLIIVECSAREQSFLPFELVKDKRYGDTRVQIFRIPGRTGIRASNDTSP